VRLRLNPVFAAFFFVVIASFAALVPQTASADDRMVVRGNYYREDSTRIIAPVVSYQKDLPDERFTLGAQYLMDTITSASIGAAAAVLGGDNLFTELRHETTASASSKIKNWGFGTHFRYSSETDYIARNVGFGVSRDFLQKSLNFSVNYSYEFDRIFRILNNVGARSPWKSNVIDDNGAPSEGPTNLLEVHYLNLGYGHVFWKTVVGGINLEGARATGPQDNPYRKVRNGEAETHPFSRFRGAASTYVLWSIPKAKMVVEPRYRYYRDDWKVQGHSIDTRLHFRVHPRFRFRLRYRYYTQTGSFFYREDGGYEAADEFKTADPKLWAFRSHTPGIQLTYELDGLARVRGLEWLEGAWIEATYNHLFRRTQAGEKDQRYGNARIGSLAFSLGF
jgi:hypothetical protein